MGEVRGGDTGFYQERDEGLVGDVRYRGGRGLGLRSGGVLHAGAGCGVEFPGGEGAGVFEGDEGMGRGGVFAGDGVEEEALDAAEERRRREGEGEGEGEGTKDIKHLIQFTFQESHSSGKKK